MIDSDSCSEAIKAARIASIMQHVRQNNIAYLIGIFVAHSMGLLDKVFIYGQGICY